MRALALVLLCAAGPACAGPCQRVKADHEAFLARAERSPQPHLSLAVPLPVVDRLLAPEVARLETLRVPMPELAGFSPGTLTLRVESVHTRAAAPGRVGFRIDAGLSQGRSRILGLEIHAVVTPRVDTKAREIVVALHGRDIESITPALGPGSARRLADLVWEELPPAARMLTSKRALEQLAAEAADELMAQAFAQVRRDLLDDLGEIAEVSLSLPELPIERVDVTTDPRDLVLAVRTALPVEGGLRETGRAGMPPDQIAVRLSGPAAVELANWGMRSGALPGRFTLEGEPADDGPLWAGLSWRTGEKPLLIHLWQLQGDCAHVRLAATPRVSQAGGQLVMRTDDARIEKVEGSARVRAGVWFSGLGRRSFSFVEEHAAKLDLEIAGRDVRAAVVSAAIVGGEVRMGVQMTSGDPRKR